MGAQLRVQVREEGADAERLDQVTRYLRQDLAGLDVDEVSAAPSGAPPPGTRAMSAVEVGGLVVALGNSAASLRSVVTAIRGWLRRGDTTPRTVRLELGGDALELSSASAADQERLIALFLSRHAEDPGQS